LSNRGEVHNLLPKQSNIPNFSVQEEDSEEPMSVDYNDEDEEDYEEDKEYCDDSLDAKMQYI
jgi:hypothetical protein